GMATKISIKLGYLQACQRLRLKGNHMQGVYSETNYTKTSEYLSITTNDQYNVAVFVRFSFNLRWTGVLLNYSTYSLINTSQCGSGKSCCAHIEKYGGKDRIACVLLTTRMKKQQQNRTKVGRESNGNLKFERWSGQFEELVHFHEANPLLPNFSLRACLYGSRAGLISKTEHKIHHKTSPALTRRGKGGKENIRHRCSPTGSDKCDHIVTPSKIANIFAQRNSLSGKRVDRSIRNRYDLFRLDEEALSCTIFQVSVKAWMYTRQFLVINDIFTRSHKSGIHIYKLYIERERDRKRHLAMRPILCHATDTYNYKLAKWLDEKLKPLSTKEYTIPDPLLFSEELRKKEIQDGEILVSYDVSSLFTNVPVDERIEILVDKAFHNEWFNKTYHLQLERSELANLLNLASVFAKLRYPLRLVDSIISQFVTKKYAEMNSLIPTEYVKRDVICVALPFKDQKSSDIVRRQLAGLGSVIGRALEPVFKSRKIKDEVKVHQMKPPIYVCLPSFSFKCNLYNLLRHINLNFACLRNNLLTIETSFNKYQNLVYNANGQNMLKSKQVENRNYNNFISSAKRADIFFMIANPSSNEKAYKFINVSSVVASNEVHCRAELVPLTRDFITFYPRAGGAKRRVRRNAKLSSILLMSWTVFDAMRMRRILNCTKVQHGGCSTVKQIVKLKNSMSYLLCVVGFIHILNVNVVHYIKAGASVVFLCLFIMVLILYSCFYHKLPMTLKSNKLSMNVKLRPLTRRHATSKISDSLRPCRGRSRFYLSVIRVRALHNHATTDSCISVQRLILVIPNERVQTNEMLKTLSTGHCSSVAWFRARHQNRRTAATYRLHQLNGHRVGLRKILEAIMRSPTH
ncbi:Hypothetical predicted protein, partial [Paramuricea clavata]